MIDLFLEGCETMTTSSSNYLIDDGYTRDGYISEVPGLHGDTGFKFRSVLHNEREQVIEQMRTPGRETTTAIMAQVICRQVVSWDIPVRLEPDQVCRLIPNLFDKLFSIVM